MNRRIPNGAWCLFRANPQGTRQGKVVLVEHREIADVEIGGHYTVKVYESQKLQTADGRWEHTSITLRPDTTASGFEAITLNADQVGSLQAVGELVAVLS
jgi:hypothetical protein